MCVDPGNHPGENYATCLLEDLLQGHGVQLLLNGFISMIFAGVSAVLDFCFSAVMKSTIE